MENSEDKPKRKVSQWKNYERKIAKIFNGERIIRPDWGKEDLDVVARPFGIECKYRKVLNYEKSLEQVEYIIRTNKDRCGLLPLAVVQKPGTVSKEEVVFRFGLLQQIGLLSDTVGDDLLDIVTVMPLKTFKEILDKKGFKYGSNVVESSG